MPITFFGNAGGGYGSATPFKRVTDPSTMGFFLNLEQSELLRIQRYDEAWRYYFGRHWLFKREDGEPLVTINYFRKILDKSVSFLVGKGFVIRTPEGLEEITKPFLDEVWEYNMKHQLAYDMATMGAITGDVFVMTTFEEPTEMQKRINPFTQGRIRINLLGSEQVYPTWDPINTNTLTAVRIETIYFSERGSVGLDSDTRVDHQGRQLYTKRFTQIITPTQIVEQFHGEMPTVRPNVLGEIPLVHVKNTSIPKEYYGLPDAQDLIDLQRELNEKATDISDVINYHACVDEETEILTDDGWKKHSQLREGEKVLGLDPESDEITWQPLEKINVFKHVGKLTRWTNRLDALTTSNHRWLAERKIGRPENVRYNRQFARTAKGEGDELAVRDLRNGSRLIVGGGIPAHFSKKRTYDDELVETVAWFVTEGSVVKLPSGSKTGILAQSERVNPEFVEEIRRLQSYWQGLGETFTEQKPRPDGVVCWYLGTNLTEALLDVSSNKSITPKFLTSLTYQQAKNFMKVLIDADGTRVRNKRQVWYQDDKNRVDGFQMLAAMLGGIRTNYSINSRGNGVTEVFQKRTTEVLSTLLSAVEEDNPTNKVWCPTIKTGVWFARRNGYTYWTGNSPITVITGAKAKQLERGPRQIWSGLPKEARVSNLTMDGNLTDSNTYLEMIKKSLFELSDIPEAALGATIPISNTSGVALHLQFQPLIEKTDKKKIQYEPGFQQINYFILRIGMVRGLINLPFDICKSCNGRIIDVQSDKTSMVWDPTLANPNDGTMGYFRPVPMMKKECFHIDKQTLDFLDPYEMRLKFWKEYGFGNQLKEMRLKDIQKDIQAHKGSFWDYTILQDKLMDKWKETNLTDDQNTIHQQVDGMNAFPQQTALEQSQGDQDSAYQASQEAPTDPTTGERQEAGMPAPHKPPPHPVPPPGLKLIPLPPDEIDVPEEPKKITVNKTYLHPQTGAVVMVVPEDMFLVPTGCHKPQYLNPFETIVHLLDVLPKDEALQANLYQTYQTQNWVDAEWVRGKIPEIARDKTIIEKRIKERDAALLRMAPQQNVVMPGGTEQTTYGSGAGADGTTPLATVPGQGGNPVSPTQQPGQL